MRARGRALFLLVAALFAASPSHADPVRGRILRGLSFRSVPGEEQVVVRFAVPVRVLRHSPPDHGTSVRIQVGTLGQSVSDVLASRAREALAAPRGVHSPVEGVVWDGRDGGPPTVEVRFTRPVPFRVRPGPDARSLTVAFPVLPEPSRVRPAPRPAPEAAPSAGAEGPATPSAPSPAGDGALDDARAALTAGELDRAVALLTRALTGPEGPHTPDARELLGVARERKGQLAHAKAEYETYLERHPDAEGAPRVRQRLEALLTARSEPTPALRPARTSREEPSRWDAFGSVSTRYLRNEREADAIGRFLSDSALLNDVFVSASRRGERFDLRGELSASYLSALAGDEDDEGRASSLFFELDDREGPLSASLGRQPGSEGGVIGTFDGVRLRARLGERFALAAVAGFPVDPWVSNGIDTGRHLLGLSFEAPRLTEQLDADVFLIQQEAEGRLDRRALGGEFRWTGDALYVAGLLDYDLHFGSLNTAYLFGSWRSSDATTWNLLLDDRNLPVLTTSNALLGQTDDSLDDLAARFSSGEIAALAEDRTARARTATLGVTHRLSSHFQVASDLSAIDLSGTPASGGIEAFRGTGLQLEAFLELSASDLLGRDEVVSVGVRTLDGDDLDLASVRIDLRIPFLRRFRLNPSLLLERRAAERGETVTTLRPRLRFDWRVGRITFDVDAWYDWTRGERFPGLGEESGTTLLLGVRYDFRVP